FALKSHQKAAAAQAQGILSQEIVSIWTGKSFQQLADKDNVVRSDSSLPSLAKLKPAFAKPFGTITAGNASPLTDGASVTMICDGMRAAALSLKPLAEIVDVEFVGIDPYDQLLIGPAIAIPRLLKRCRLKLSDIDRFEIHEAFAAQMLSCLQALDSPDYFVKYFGTRTTLGEIPADKLNVHGGAIALGHPFGASGSRLVNTLAFELKRQNLEYGLVAMCAAGGMAGCMLLKNISL
ncbi:MAG: thiolase family protein, partial [Proteobacteria bacterium]|nr:thiolase family protein [Pseudomonadota bacterium]